MKKYQVLTVSHNNYERHGFKNAPRTNTDESIEEIVNGLKNWPVNIHYRIKDLETKKIVAEGTTK